MVHLSDLPADLLLDTLLPVLSIASLVSLGCTSKAWHELILDAESATANSIWRHRLATQKNFPVQNTARTSGWLDLFKRALFPEIYVWGDAGQGRLGLTTSELRASRTPFQVCVPTRLAHFPKGTSIVQCSAGGWSFHALDSKGRVWFWGTMGGDGWAPPGSPFTNPFRAQPNPALLEADFGPGNKVVQLDCGRAHAAARDVKGNVYEWRCWGRVARIQDAERRWSTVKSLSAGWSFTCVLVDPHPSVSQPQQQQQKKLFIHFAPPQTRVSRAASSQPVVASEGYEQPTVTFDLDVDSMALPSLPFEAGEDVAQMATGDHFVLVLSTTGRLFKLEVSAMNDNRPRRQDEETEPEGMMPRERERLTAAFMSGERQWVYLSRFCQASELSKRTELQGKDLSGLSFTHISAHYNRFAVYSASGASADKTIVLIGDKAADEESVPLIKPELQGRGVIKIVQGDYHFGAITSDGQLLTWGRYSSGALGHGEDNELLGERDSEDVGPAAPLETPTAVDLTPRSKNKGKKFVFDAAFAGWHSSCLAVDLDPSAQEEGQSSDDEEEEEERNDMPGSFRHEAASSSPQAPPPPPSGNRPTPPPNFRGRVLPGGRRPFNPIGLRRGFPLRGMNRGAGGAGNP